MMRLLGSPKSLPSPQTAPRTIIARKLNDLRHVDLTTVPTAPGFWTPWLPFALPQVWPFCWWVGVAIDHCSRRIMGFAVYRGQLSSRAVRGFLEHLFREVRRQFVAKEFRRWCRRHGILQRFGAIGGYGPHRLRERQRAGRTGGHREVFQARTVALVHRRRPGRAGVPGTGGGDHPTGEQTACAH